MPFVEETYDIIVVGAGHAGCEAALAAARLGFETIMFTVSVDSIALMPCNPNIGGSSKGHLVRELDALGGEMGKNIDKTFIQSKMLNESKGPAVHSLRAQADKQDYTASMRQVLENTEHLTIRQAEVTELLTEPVEPDAELLSEPEKLPSESMKLPSELAEPSSESAGSGKKQALASNRRKDDFRSDLSRKSGGFSHWRLS